MRRTILVGCCLVISTAAVAQRADTVVRAAGRPVHAGAAELRREVAIGVVDGDQNYMIGAINDIAVAANGTMYVLDRSVPAVRVYDAAGKFVKNIGRAGSGPGEFRGPAGISVAKNGNLLLWDPGNSRVNVYSAGGETLTSWPTLSGSSSASGRGLLMSDTTGTTYIRATIFQRNGQRITPPERGWMRFGPDGALRDTVPEPKSASQAMLSAQQGGAYTSTGVPFAPVFYSQVSPLGYVVTGLASRLAVDLHEPGKPIASIRRDVALEPVTSRERDSARAHVTESMRKTDPAWSWNGPEIPRTKAAFTGLRIGADGLLWVELAKGPRYDDGSGTPQPSVRMGGGSNPGGGRGPSWSCPTDGWSLHDVYEPSGRYLGQVKLPQRVSVIMMRGDFVWGAACNEDDAPQVVRYRIAWR